MINNRLTNTLLGLLVLGVWGLLIHFTIQNWMPTAEAQTRKAAATESAKKYGLAAVDKSGTLKYDGNGTTVLTATGLQAVLASAPAEGWKIHSVVFSEFNYTKGWTVIVEKKQ